MSLRDVISRCHLNDTIYHILQMQHVYDVRELRQWRKEFGIGGFIQNLKSKIQLDDLKGIQILSPQAEKDLQELAESQISDLNFTQYTRYSFSCLFNVADSFVSANVSTARLKCWSSLARIWIKGLKRTFASPGFL